MLETSKDYNPYSDTRKCGIIVTFEMVDIDAAETAIPSVTGECELSKAYQTHNHIEGMAKKYAVLERDFWKLDGTFVLPQKELVPNEQTGWWSDKISNAEGVFEHDADLKAIVRIRLNRDNLLRVNECASDLDQHILPPV